MKHQDIISKLTLMEKCYLLSGKDFWQTRSVKAKDIPNMTLSDGPHGVRKQEGAGDQLGLNRSIPATCFPTAATVANSWDPALGEEIGRCLGEEAASQGVCVLLGPGLNIKRSPLCGRNFEYFSEDPYLAGKMAAAYIRGIQANGVSACPKHFAANNTELRRQASDSVVDERTLREIYLTGFEIAVKEAAPKSIMSSYNMINGVYANENEHLLQKILRDQWGFDGFVVSDWGASNDHVAGVAAGSHLEMPSTGGDSDEELIQAVKDGKISEELVDRRVDELLDVVLSTRKAVDSRMGKPFDVDAHHAMAQKASEQSIVLLKNDNNILPLKKGSKVAVIGEFAQRARYQGAGSSVVNCTKLDNAMDVIGNFNLNVVGFEAGYPRSGAGDRAMQAKAVELAQKADYVLLYIGVDTNSVSLASQISKLGVTASYDPGSGTWTIVSDKWNPSYVGRPLLSSYHTGGIAGDNPTLKQKEMLAILEKGEAILDKKKESALYHIIDFNSVLSEKLNKAIGSIGVSGISNIAKNSVDTTHAPLPAVTNNQSEAIHFGDVYIYGADGDTVRQHQEINRKFTNEILSQLRIKR